MSNDEDWKTHPSYGLVGLARVGGTYGRLFGSVLPRHEGAILLRVQRTSECDSDGVARYYSRHADSLVEVYLTSAQFAELLTTMNIGQGVPCTLRSVGGVVMAPPPESDPLPTERLHAELGKRAAALSNKVAGIRETVEGIFSKPTPPTKADKSKILQDLDVFASHLRSNLPYVLEQFEESAAKIVGHAKAAVDAVMTHRVIEAGLAKLGGTHAMETPRLNIPQCEDGEHL